MIVKVINQLTTSREKWLHRRFFFSETLNFMDNKNIVNVRSE